MPSLEGHRAKARAQGRAPARAPGRVGNTTATRERSALAKFASQMKEIQCPHYKKGLCVASQNPRVTN